MSTHGLARFRNPTGISEPPCRGAGVGSLDLPLCFLFLLLWLTNAGAGLAQEPSPPARSGGAVGQALLEASSGGHLEEVELLLSQGAPADARNDQGETPLMLAALYARPEVVEALLEAGADPNAVSEDGSTPLLQAVVGAGEQREEHPELVPVYRRIAAVLLGAGADPNTKDGFDYTALENAQAYGIPELVALLEKAEGW